MKIIVKLFSHLKKYSPYPTASGEPFEFELPEGASLEDLVRILNLPKDLVKVQFVSGAIDEKDWRLHEDDSVGIFPPTVR
jgi:hypothetical protein